MKCSLLVTTYDLEGALSAVLASVRRQTRLPDEVVIADDDFRRDTSQLLAEEANTFPTALRHVRHEEQGFRSADIRNRGIAASRGDYMICIEGDTVLHPHFIADHIALAERGNFLHGGSLTTTAQHTEELIAGKIPVFGPWMPVEFTAKHGEKRRHIVRWLWLARQKARSAYPGLTIASSNMSFWREDLLRVNGYNGRIQYPGREDLEIDVRLRNAGIQRRRVRYAGLALRLHDASRRIVHPDDESPSNLVLRSTALHRLQRCELGVDRYLDTYRQSPVDLRPQTAGSRK